MAQQLTALLYDMLKYTVENIDVRPKISKIGRLSSRCLCRQKLFYTMAIYNILLPIYSEKLVFVRCTGNENTLCIPGGRLLKGMLPYNKVLNLEMLLYKVRWHVSTVKECN